MPDQFDSRSETNIETLLPAAQPVFRKFLASLLAAGLDARFISGTRTYAEQTALYQLGRTMPGHIVTNAKAGYSSHNFGIAVDIGIWVDGNYEDDGPGYDRAGALGIEGGLEWGGAWQTMVDRPHFQVRTGLTMAELRQRVASGTAILPDPEVAGPTLSWNGGRLGECWIGADGHAYYPARSLLNYVQGVAAVGRSLQYDAASNRLRWNSAPISAPVLQRGTGIVWVQVRALATWLGLRLTVSDDGQQIGLSRP